jgi:hypothetical protein
MHRSDWRFRLHAGDEVTWNDPDGGSCSFTGIVSELVYKPDSSAWILFSDGHEIEVYLEELS